MTKSGSEYLELARRLKATKPKGSRRQLIVLFRHYRMSQKGAR